MEIYHSTQLSVLCVKAKDVEQALQPSPINYLKRTKRLTQSYSSTEGTDRINNLFRGAAYGDTGLSYRFSQRKEGCKERNTQRVGTAIESTDVGSGC